VDGLVKLKGV
jgi:H+/Cl- antiporter ClcA